MAAPTASRDRITRIHVTGFRSLADVTLDLDGLTVLIGDNGSGKSSLIEVFETLRYFTEPASNLRDYALQHPAPIRRGSATFRIEVLVRDMAGAEPDLTYSMEVAGQEWGLAVAAESFRIAPHGDYGTLEPLRREGERASTFDPSNHLLSEVQVDSHRLLLTYAVSQPRPKVPTREEQRAIARLGTALSRIEVHVPFESMPTWAARRSGRKSAMREANILQSTSRLELLAANLGNAFHSLKNDHGGKHWSETLECVRLGLGNDVDDISASADAAGGQHAVSVRFASIGNVPATALSDGTLSYLAFVALLRLPSARSLLAFDEPELHLHPGLLVRVLSMFESMAESCPVVLATHSDRLLDALQDPAQSVVLCDLDDKRAARLLRPNKAMLTKWLTKYRGLGDIRSTGLQDAVIPRPEADR